MPASEVVFTAGRHKFRYLDEPRCAVCRDPDRARIEDLILEREIDAVLPPHPWQAVRTHRSDARIAQEIAGGRVSGRSISRHIERSHFPIRAMIRNMLVEWRANEIGERLARSAP